MVYRGKPSAGCENCRKAKKRCGLEQPACLRCVKLKKVCAGYRDTTQLQIQDESEAVRRKANRPKRRGPALKPAITEDNHNFIANSSSSIVIKTDESSLHEASTPSTGAPSAITPISESNSSRLPDRTDTVARRAPSYQGVDFSALWQPAMETSASTPTARVDSLPASIMPEVDDIAMNYFYDQFTASSGHWTFLRDATTTIKKDPLLDVSMRACGMAALHNVRGVTMGREYARSVYGEAIRQLNGALRDPKMCKLDSTLISVAMLGYYENLVCDSIDSIRSWKAHISGATQLLRLRGKNQFRTTVGRMLYREIRTQVLISCIWDMQEPPAFILEWENELQKQSANLGQVPAPPDRLAVICFDIAMLRFRVRHKTLSSSDAIHMATDIQTRLIQWSMSTMSFGEAWHYQDLTVPESPHVWNGVVHAYNSLPAAGTWNVYRMLRILVTRVQETLYQDSGFNPEVIRAKTAHFRGVRRQLTDEICSAVPSQLGHAAPALNSPCVLITAYSSIWPLFFSASCALERVGYDVWSGFLHLSRGGTPESNTSDAAAQAKWIIGRVKYIGEHVGLRWAAGFAKVLSGDVCVNADMTTSDPGWLERRPSSISTTSLASGFS